MLNSPELKTQPIILCGGSGTRLWPLSRAGLPKQFLCLTGNDSLFQQAAQRLTGLATEGIQIHDPLIVTGEEHRFLALEQLREIDIKPAAVLLEPIGRNTAPALTLAALSAIENNNDPVLVVTPADQTAWAHKTTDTPFVRPSKETFAAIPSESVDSAVMERCPGSEFPIKMLPLNAGWNDLGAWDAVWNVQAKDYVRMQWMMLQQEPPEDFVIATDVQYSVRQFIQWSAAELGLTLKFEGQSVEERGIVQSITGDNAGALKVGDVIVKIDPRYFRPTEVKTLLGDPSKAKEKLGWAPEITVQEMCREMVAVDLKAAKRHALLKAHGHTISVSLES